MVKIDAFKPTQIETFAPVRPIIGLLPEMEMIGDNLPTNYNTPPKCLIRHKNYVREYLLVRVAEGNAFEPLEIPENIYSWAEFHNLQHNYNLNPITA